MNEEDFCLQKERSIVNLKFDNLADSFKKLAAYICI
uniref:Uncharacterized protein n=1 Tax=Onchocerca volvulus TaxID=6282 RepID=A0A8R1XTA6_ONCVO